MRGLAIGIALTVILLLVPGGHILLVLLVLALARVPRPSDVPHGLAAGVDDLSPLEPGDRSR